MDYRALIRNWHLKAGEEDYFSKFVFEYLAFIAFLKTQKNYEEDNDRKTIQKLKQDETVKKRYLKEIRFSRDLTENWEKIRTKLIEKILEMSPEICKLLKKLNGGTVHIIV